MKLSNYVIPARLAFSAVSPKISDRIRQDLTGQKFTKVEVLYTPVSPLPPVFWVYACQACYFYKDPRQCGIVDGDIAPGGYCVLWVNKAEEKPFSWVSLEGVQDRVILQEMFFRQTQADYFRTRQKTGAVLALNVYMPSVEPDRGSLAAIFYEPGAAHLVFYDEVAPAAALDERYRSIRQQIYGRQTDVESVEFLDGDRIKLYNNASLVQPYQSSFHYSQIDPYKGNVYVNTWNHMVSSKPSPVIRFLEGGYRLHEAQSYSGTREDADRWEP